VEHIVDVSNIAIIAVSSGSVLGVTIRCLFRFLDHRGDRQLFRWVVDKTGSANEFDGYIKLRRAERPAIIVSRKPASRQRGSPPAKLPIL
jgi:hypothetical protein